MGKQKKKQGSPVPTDGQGPCSLPLVSGGQGPVCITGFPGIKKKDRIPFSRDMKLSGDCSLQGMSSPLAEKLPGSQGEKVKVPGFQAVMGYGPARAEKTPSSRAVSSAVAAAFQAKADVPLEHGVLGSNGPQQFEPEQEIVVVDGGDDDDFSDEASLDEMQFPALPRRRPSSAAPSATAPPPSLDGNNGMRPNAWVNTPKKVFMNSGLGGKLSFTPPTSGRVEIKLSEGLSKQQVWGWSLLGQYVGFHPGHFLINSMMKSWGVKAKYRIEEGWFIFQFGSEEDQDKVLKGGPYFIYGKPMLLKHIPEKFAFNRKDIATIPLWVRMFGISRTFWTPEVLGRIASHIGKPLFMDPVTDSRKRGSYARVLVEVNFAEPIVREVSLAFDDGEVLGGTFLIENEPKYCKGCCSLGHTDEDCSFKEKKSGVGVNARRSRTKNGKTIDPGKVDSRPCVDDIRACPEAPKAPTMNEVSTSTVLADPVVMRSNVTFATGAEENGLCSEGATSDGDNDSDWEAGHDRDCEYCASPEAIAPASVTVGEQQVDEEVPFQVVRTRSRNREALKKDTKVEANMADKASRRGSTKENLTHGSKKEVGKKDKMSS